MPVYPNFPGNPPPPKKDEEQPQAADGSGLGDIAGEGVGAALEGAGSCLEGCGGCSAAVLVALFLAAGTARAAFELLR